MTKKKAAKKPADKQRKNSGKSNNAVELKKPQIANAGPSKNAWMKGVSGNPRRGGQPTPQSFLPRRSARPLCRS